MLKRFRILIFVLFIFINQAIIAQTVDIINLHDNNSSGEPNLLDQLVTVSGEVTVSSQLGIVASIQDSTGGVMVYDGPFANNVAIGDNVVISGTVSQYRGLTELTGVTILSQTPSQPKITPQIITCSDIANEGAGGIENFEGELVRINNVTVSTTTWGANSNYTLSDATGSCTIRIDDECNIANTSAPSGEFDVIGVVSQYDYSPPYTSGYQLMPRFLDDIIWLSGIRIIGNSVVDNITPYSLSILWETDIPSNSILIFGLTENYELDTLRVDESVTNHTIEMSGLTPATVYHVKVGSSDGSEQFFSGDQVVITASDPSSTGKINVYFNQSVEPFYADSVEATSDLNLLSKLIQRVNDAKYSIDFCFYNVTQEEASQVLIGAHQRGVKVRVITESDHVDQYPIQMLKNAGIPVIDDKFGNNGGSGYMHNKFMIVDHRDDSSFSDDWVWTGSYNISFSATYNNAENVIEIQDQALAACYTMEFNEMWGSSDDSPDASNSLFGSTKTPNTPHYFNINGVEVMQVMSPADGGVNYIVNEIEQAQSSIYFCIYSFTQNLIADAMREKWYNVSNFKVKGVFDSPGKHYDNYSGTGTYPWNPPADVVLENEAGLLHHKYLIIDANGGPGDPVVISGSYNWSLSAENSNDENFLIFKNKAIANLYFQEFAARYHNAGGSDFLTYTPIQDEETHTLPENVSLSQNFPNPFNSSTQIRFTVPYNLNNNQVALKIFNLNGQIVASVIEKKLAAGSYEVQWDGMDIFGSKAASGVYLYQLKIGTKYSTTKKMIMIE